MGTYELHEHAAERKRYVDDQPVFVAAEIKDDPVIAHEIDGTAELPLDLSWICLLCVGGNREPGPDRSFRMRVARPKFLQRPAGDHLHGDTIYHVTDLVTSSTSGGPASPSAERF